MARVGCLPWAYADQHRIRRHRPSRSIREATRVAPVAPTHHGWDDDAGRGSIELGEGRAELTARDGALDLRIESNDLARFEDVIGRHLVRFGKKDELVVQWTRDDGTPGTSYRNDSDESVGEH